MKGFRIWAVGLAVAGVAAAAVLLAPAVVGQVGDWRGHDEARLLDDVHGLGQRIEAQLADVWSGSRIGASVRDVDEADAKREKLPELAGAVVDEVRSESPASRAGLQAGDVIVQFDGERVRSARQLTRLVQETPAGRTVKLAVYRAGARQELDITPEAGSALTELRRLGPRLEELERGRAFRFELPEFDLRVDRFRRGRLGVSVEELSPQLRDYFGVDRGVLVSSVEDESPASAAGMRAGDVIVSVDGRQIEDASALRRALARADAGREIAVELVRDKQPLTLTVTLPDRPSRGTTARPVIAERL